DSFVTHTAGAVPLHILGNISNRYGVLYPLQSFRKELETVPAFPLLIDANKPLNLQELNTFATSLSNTVITADDETRLKYHAGAVIVNNFTNHLFTLAEDWCKKEGIAFSLLQPLIQETFNRIARYSPAGLQTGPAVRNDTQTIDKHRQILNQYPGLLQLYDAFTTNIQQFHNNK
ncbi:MAG: DUF2520 domain-containing protein, partial [Bacteroidota bacterium]|nr:DUF2520 domain-containing protein [Bacteroidota bacterium]